MTRARTAPPFPRPHTIIEGPRCTLRFYRGDCLDVFAALAPGSVSAIVTSPPYNLGITYRSYEDTMPRAAYLEWSGRWIAAARLALAPKGSLFLNVGAKPTDPWTAMEVALVARPHLQLQNTIHWIKSIAIEKSLAGTNANLADDLAVGHYKPAKELRPLISPRGAPRLVDTASLGRAPRA